MENYHEKVFFSLKLQVEGQNLHPHLVSTFYITPVLKEWAYLAFLDFFNSKTVGNP